MCLEFVRNISARTRSICPLMENRKGINHILPETGFFELLYCRRQCRSLRRSKSFKFTKFRTNRNHINCVCDFLLVNNTNLYLHSILHHFQVIGKLFAPTIRLSHDDILARHQKHLIIIIIIIAYYWSYFLFRQEYLRLTNLFGVDR